MSTGLQPAQDLPEDCSGEGIREVSVERTPPIPQNLSRSSTGVEKSYFMATGRGWTLSVLCSAWVYFGVVRKEIPVWR